jgi:hypothetical protein
MHEHVQQSCRHQHLCRIHASVPTSTYVNIISDEHLPADPVSERGNETRNLLVLLPCSIRRLLYGSSRPVLRAPTECQDIAPSKPEQAAQLILVASRWRRRLARQQQLAEPME